MAHHRATSSISGGAGGAHAISLKVLRLSRPALATQTPLPPTHFGNGLDIPSVASLAYPSAEETSSFPLTPLLTLPPAFGAAYVGETFMCTLCANNELREGDNKSVSGVRIVAELQTPSSAAPVSLELVGEGEEEDKSGRGVDVHGTLQRTLRHELKEEGQHVLAVTVTYTETLHGEGGGASGGRARTFRKLYQFVAQSLIAVRSKVTERKRKGDDGARQWILEAQLENVGETSVVLEKLRLNEREGIQSKPMNGEATVLLKPRDAEQVMFLLREQDKVEEDSTRRTPLAQLTIDWRAAMGEFGSLTTGWLATRAR